MVSRDDRPAAIADLLGLVRAMHLAKRRAGGGEADLERLANVGRILAKALVELGLSAPGSLYYYQAIAMAERAADDLGELVKSTDSAEPIVKAAQERVMGACLARTARG